MTSGAVASGPVADVKSAALAPATLGAASAARTVAIVSTTRSATGGMIGRPELHQPADDDLRHALVHENLHKIEVWTARHGVAIADWPATPVDPFFNVNTPADAAEADRIATQYADA